MGKTKRHFKRRNRKLNKLTIDLAPDGWNTDTLWSKGTGWKISDTPLLSQERRGVELNSLTALPIPSESQNSGEQIPVPWTGTVRGDLMGLHFEDWTKLHFDNVTLREVFPDGSMSADLLSKADPAALERWNGMMSHPGQRVVNGQTREYANMVVDLQKRSLTEE